MSDVSRRTFVGWLSAVGAALGLARGAAAAAVVPDGTTRPMASPLEQDKGLDAAMLIAIAGAVLPGELGGDGHERAGRAFGRWVGAYAGDAEVLHGYGTAAIARTKALPLARWRGQLAALNQVARTKSGKPFVALDAPERQRLVRQALASDKGDRLGAPDSASHVAVALLSHFYASSEATDLCYQVQIAKNRCRPLVNAAREPLPLAPRRRT